MTREQILRITVLTVCLYALTTFLQTGTWIFPFPIYEVALFIAVTALLVSEKKKPDIIGWLSVVWSLCFLLCSAFVIELLLPYPNAFSATLFYFLFVLFLVVFVVWIVSSSFRFNNRTFVLLTCIQSVAFAVFAYLGSLWALLPLVLLYAVFIIGKRPSVERNILFLFTFFYATKQLTLWWMGTNM